MEKLFTTGYIAVKMKAGLPPFFSCLIAILLYSRTFCAKEPCHYDDYANEDKDKGVQNLLDYLEYLNRTQTLLSIELNLLGWKHSTNMTTENSIEEIKCSLQSHDWHENQKKRIMRLTDLSSLNAKQKRMLYLYNLTLIFSDKEKLKKLHESLNAAEEIYSTAQVVLDNGTRLAAGESGPITFFRKETHYDRLLEVWKKWRDVSGKKIRPYYIEQIKMLNEKAKENGYSDAGQMGWLLAYEDPHFNEKVIVLYKKIKPMYQEMHAYVRYKLSQLYPGRFPANGPVPAHLFGNMWAQDWVELFDLLKPFKSVNNSNIDNTMLAQKWTVKKMVEKSDEFYTSLGLDQMTALFWNNSFFQNPGGRPFDCHASASDMASPGDFRIKMCGEVNLDDFKTIHHEMGHIQYYMCYRSQPYVFHDGANEAFHEAIGDTITLSAMTDSHLRKVGLYPNTETTKDQDMNHLMRTALMKLAFLPFGLLMDIWLWRVSNGSVPESEFNKEWWRLRTDLQGVMPPVPRSESDFDPAAKHHVATRVTYIRYFISHFLQFQFYAAMCKKSGHKGPLHQCDFYQSKPAGELLKSMLQLGSSVEWPEALETMTGQKKVSTEAMEEYFSPLVEWLRVQRKTLGYPIGW